MTWNPTGGQIEFLEDRLRRGEYNGKQLFLHYTDQSTWVQVVQDQTLRDYRRNETRPGASRGIYLCPAYVTLPPDEAWQIVFIGEQPYARRGDYVLVFSFEPQVPLVVRPTTSGGWVEECIYPRRELTFQLRDWLWSGRNPFISVFDQNNPELGRPKYIAEDRRGG